MDIKEFFNDFKERFASPLFSSFLVAWLIINWKIPIGVMFYKISDLQVDGYMSFIDLIDKNSNPWISLWYPLICAIGYTFFYPFFKNIILAFNAWIHSWGNKWNLRISKSGKVPMLKYIRLRERYTETTKALEKLIEEESLHVKEITDLKGQRTQDQLTTSKAAEAQQLKINDISEKLQSWTKSEDIRIIKGIWNFSITHEGDKLTRKIKIDHTGIYELTPDTGPVTLWKELYKVESFHLNPINNLATLICLPNFRIQTPKFHLFKLNIEKGADNMRGKMDIEHDVTFKKIKANEEGESDLTPANE